MKLSENVYELVTKIPKGKVTTYGDCKSSWLTKCKPSGLTDIEK